MSFVELDLGGIYVAPISALLVLSWIATVLLRRIADRFALLTKVWHPPLFVGAVYVTVLSLFVLLVGL